MHISDFITELRKSGIVPFLEGNELKLKIKSGKVSGEVLKEASIHKNELIELLRSMDESATNFGKADVADDYPVTPQQRAIWILSQDVNSSVSYNIPLIIEFSNEIEVGLVKDAIQDVVERQESLRTCFFQDDNGEVRQKVDPARPIYLEERDCWGMDETELLRAITDECMKPFDLAEGPLMRASLLRKDEVTAVLVLRIHHIVFDGASLNLFVHDFTTAYKGRKNGGKSPLKPLQVTYKDFAVWQAEAGNDKQREREEEFWRRTLDGNWPRWNLSSSRRPPIKTNVGRHSKFHLSKDMLEPFEEFCISNRVSLFSGLLAVFNVLFYRYTGVEDLVIGTISSGRELPYAESLIGLFVNAVPIRTKIFSNSDFRSMLMRQQEILGDALSHSKLPFRN